MNFKKVFCLFSFLPLSANLRSENVMIKSNNSFFETKCQGLVESISDFNNSKFDFEFSFKCSNDSYNLYSLSEENQYKGYFIIHNLNKIVTVYKGDYKPKINDDISLLSPIFANGQKCIDNEISSNDEFNLASTISYNPPTVNEDLYVSSYDSFVSEQKIKDCPTYYNPTDFWCVPTASAMLISFYDRYTNLNNLIDGLLPLNYEDNKPYIFNLISTLAGKYMNTNSYGTDFKNQNSGLNKYFEDKGYGNYKARTSTDFDAYSQMINKYTQPSIVWIPIMKDNKLLSHAVLGVGSATIRESGRYFICHYGEENHNLGDYYLPKEKFSNFTYLGC